MSELEEVLGRMGNEIMSLIGTTRNLSLDYQKLTDILAKLSQPRQSPQQQEAKPKEPMGMRDRVILTVRDKNGNVKQEYDSGWSENGITNDSILYAPNVTVLAKLIRKYMQLVNLGG
jgi:hypothetical protein